MSFDKISAVYVYCMDYHGGQWSREYALLCRIQRQYKLKLTDSSISGIRDGNNPEWDEAHDIYAGLVRGLV